MDDLREKLPKSEFMEYAMILEQYHSIFYRIIAMSQLWFDKNVPTACVRFLPDDGEPIQLVFGPDFWDSLSTNERLWIIAHEMWHIVNGHGKRMIVLKEDSEKTKMNKAMDIVVHYSLENSLGMDREEYFPVWRDYCFVETVFPGRTDVLEGQNSEYYYNLIQEPTCNSSDKGKSGNGGKGGGSGNGEGDKELITWEPGSFDEETQKKVFEKLADTMSKEEIQDLIDVMNGGNIGGLQPGNSSLGAWLAVRVAPVKPQPRWETVIKKWVRKRIKEEFQDIESWVDMNRRMSQVLEINKDIFLPVETEKYLEAKNKGRNKLLFFLDASGSVYKYRDRFFTAARSVPKQRFDVEVASFDTRVFKLDIKQPVVRGGGGTAFNIMENYIKTVYIPEHGHYPDAIFVITDGYGNNIKPQYPERWYWFMTPYSSEHCIPKTSHKYNLKDYT
jgi:hypothetical protein